MVTAVNSARGVFTEIAVGRCFAIRCCSSARDHGTEEMRGDDAWIAREYESGLRLCGIGSRQVAGRAPFAPSLRLLGNAMQVKAGTARPGKVTTRSRKR